MVEILDLESLSGLRVVLEIASGLGFEVASGLGLGFASGLGLGFASGLGFEIASGFVFTLGLLFDCALAEIEFFSGDSSRRVKRSFFCLDLISDIDSSDFFLLNFPNTTGQLL
jgi:hypothetical protein